MIRYKFYWSFSNWAGRGSETITIVEADTAYKAFLLFKAMQGKLFDILMINKVV